MSRLRRNIEDYFLRNATELVAGAQSELLAEALEELEQKSAEVAAADARAEQLERKLAGFGATQADDKTEIDHLLAELERRDGELAKLRTSVKELTVKLASATADLDARERCLNEQVRRAGAQARWVEELEQRAADAEAGREAAERNLRARDADEQQRTGAAAELAEEGREFARREAELPPRGRSRRDRDVRSARRRARRSLLA